MTQNMRNRLIAGVVLIAVGIAGLAYVGSRARRAADGETWGGPMMQGPMMQGPMMQGPMMQGPMMQGPMMQGPMTQGPMKDRPGMRGRLLPPIAGARAISIEVTDTALTPSQVSVKAGEAVNITLVNRGATARDVAVRGYGIRLVVPAGQTVTTGFRGDVPGEYEFYVRTQGRREAGLTGRITVTP